MMFRYRPKAASEILMLMRRFGVVAVLTLSVCLNVAQANKLGLFRNPVILPAIGSAAPPVIAQSLTGVPIEIPMVGQSTILYYFSPQCAWCEKNWLNVKAVMAGTRSRYRFIGLSTSPDVTEFLEARQLRLDVYTRVSTETVRAYDLGATPRTVVIDAKGRITHVWAGAYTGKLQSDVEQALDVVLPGLVAPKGRAVLP